MTGELWSERLAAALADPGTAGLAVALAVALLAVIVLALRLRAAHERLVLQAAEQAETETGLRGDLAQARAEVQDAQARIESWIAAKTRAETELAATEERLATAIAERDHAIVQRDIANGQATEAEKSAALRAQQLVDIELRLADWDKARDESLQAAKAAVLTTASELSNKLLEDHKREAAEAKKDADERVRKTTEDLLRQMGEVTKSVAALDHQVDATRDRMETVWKALSSPGGAGQFAEIGLENTLKKFGLEKGRDFLIQSTVEGSRLRPDALVLLPGDAVLVIDCKASKFLLDLAAAEGTPAEDDAYRSLARTMNGHLKALADRHYRAEIVDGWRQAGRTSGLERVVSVMYLPNEGAIEKLHRADPDFRDKARRQEISLAGPEALACLIAFASVQIDFVRRVDNQEQIVEATRSLIDYIGVVLDHAEKVGKGIKTAADGYVALTGSVNGRLLPKVRGIMAKGVRSTRSKPIRDQLPTYQVVALETGVIEGEADEVGEIRVLGGTG